MTIPALPALSRTSPTFRADLDALFLTQLPATTGALNAAILDIDAAVIAAAGSATAAAGSATTASTAKVDAQAARDAAQASAASALLAPGTSATSSTSLTISEGPQTLTIQTGKQFSIGQWVVISSAVSPANQMTGQITTHDNVAGALTVQVSSVGGGGTFASWVVALTATVSVAAIRTPSNIAPASGTSTDNPSPLLTGSLYYSLYGLGMAASQWQVSIAADFSTTVLSTADVAGTATTYTVAAGILAVSTTYYWRVRYKDAEGTYSAWSTGTSFATDSAFNSYISTPTATPSSFGDAFEGGFYTGMIWNEVVQSATSTNIGTGSKSFTVTNMTGSPIVYGGQTLEVRSRANPANKMIGTVTNAFGTTLTLNITSVGGSGTFTDWSIMSRYRVIVAPKASGENASIEYKNANTAAPAACGTLSEGRKATLAMVAAGTSTVYPAAHYCNNLTIGGKTDWYLPARDELELCWRNLKPTADANYTTADRSASATPNYQNLGSYGGTEATHGLNKNSDPAGTAYTSGVPAQTAATAFRTGGVEAFEYSSVYYWSSSEYSASDAWVQPWFSSSPGYQSNSNKSNSCRVRAVRRSII